MVRNKWIFILFGLLYFLITGSVQAQTKIGVGVALFDIQQILMEGAGSTITVPVITSSTFRIEPELGYYSMTREHTFNGITTKDNTRALSIGAGIFLQKVYSEFTLYYGGRIGYISQKQTEEVTDEPTNESSNSGLYVAPAIGGEHNFSEHFSIGAEAELYYTPLTNEVTGRAYDEDISLLNLRGLVFFRFYF